MNTEQPITLHEEKSKRDQIITYIKLRILIGATGILLPFLVVMGKFISQKSGNLEYSISDYYDNGAGGDILVGVLFVLGFFLMSYKGPEPIDNKVANVGWVSALGVALFPTTYCSKCWVHYMHFVFALVLFTVFILFSVWLFRKTKKGKEKEMTQQKIYRNRIYLTCGIVMILCIAAIAVSMIWIDNATTEKYHLVYWFESLALVSFGISWITKSESFYLKDKKNE
jgi:heme A synthase